jgi:hypothetical protein
VAPDLEIHYEDDDFADPWRAHDDVRGLATGAGVVSLASFADLIHDQGLAAWFAQTGRARLGSSAGSASG